MPPNLPSIARYFETFSYLPALSNDAIVKQVDYIVNNGWTPCLEFADPEHAYVSNENCIRFAAASSGYQDNRVRGHGRFVMAGTVLAHTCSWCATSLSPHLLTPLPPLAAVLDHVEAAHVWLH